MSLSINSIVIIVLAFVMLGLGLTLTNTVFNSANQAVGSAIATIAQDVSASSAVGYQAIVTKGNLPSGTFICQLVAKDTSSTPNTVTTQIGIIIES